MAGGSDHHHELALARSPCPFGGQFCRRASQPFLEFLGEFPGEDHRAPGQDQLQFAQQALHPERRFIKHQGSGNRAQFAQAAGALSGLVRQESGEVERFGGQPAGGQTDHQSAGSGDGFHPKPGGQHLGHHAFAGIADARSTGVGDQRHDLSHAQPVQDLRAAPRLIEAEVADHGFAEAEVGEQLAGAAGVFGSDHRAIPQHPQGPQSDVFEVPDGCGHEIQRSGYQWGDRCAGRR